MISVGGKPVGKAKEQNYLHGAAILTAGVVIMKILGASCKITARNLLGDDGYGVQFLQRVSDAGDGRPAGGIVEDDQRGSHAGQADAGAPHLLCRIVDIFRIRSNQHGYNVPAS